MSACTPACAWMHTSLAHMHPFQHWRTSVPILQWILDSALCSRVALCLVVQARVWIIGETWSGLQPTRTPRLPHMHSQPSGWLGGDDHKKNDVQQETPMPNWLSGWCMIYGGQNGSVCYAEHKYINWLGSVLAEIHQTKRILKDYWPVEIQKVCFILLSTKINCK